MTQEFSPNDFLPLKQQTTVLLTILTSQPPTPLSSLLPALTEISTHLTTLHSKSRNPASLLRQRCADRHPEWLQILFDLANTLCECQDLVSSSPSKGENHGHAGGKFALDNDDEDGEADELGQLEGELSTHAWTLETFLETLGLSKLGRSDPSLGEIERILLETVRCDREGRQTRRSQRADLKADEDNGGEEAGEEEEEEEEEEEGYSSSPLSGSPYRVNMLLRMNGVDDSEIERLDTKIKQLVGWVLRNEREISRIRDLEAVVEQDEGLRRAFGGFDWQGGEGSGGEKEIEKEKEKGKEKEVQKKEVKEDKAGNSGADSLLEEQLDTSKPQEERQAAEQKPCDDVDDELVDYVWV